MNSQNYPRVTEVCSSILNINYSRCPQNNLDYGSHVHRLLELYDKGTLDKNSIDLALIQDLAGWQKFVIDYRITFYAIEQPVVSNKYFYKGTLDRVALITKGLFSDKVAVIDIKTSVDINEKYCALQTDAYKIAYNESRDKKSQPRATHKLVVQLVQDGTYRVYDLNKPQNNGMFIHAIGIYNWSKIK